MGEALIQGCLVNFLIDFRQNRTVLAILTAIIIPAKNIHPELQWSSGRRSRKVAYKNKTQAFGSSIINLQITSMNLKDNPSPLLN